MEGDSPVAFNAGIKAEDYPTKQVTSKHLLQRMTLVGMGAKAAKVDMENAYKHVPVRPEDVILQFIRV